MIKNADRSSIRKLVRLLRDLPCRIYVRSDEPRVDINDAQWRAGFWIRLHADAVEVGLYTGASYWCQSAATAARFVGEVARDRFPLTHFSPALIKKFQFSRTEVRSTVRRKTRGEQALRLRAAVGAFRFQSSIPPSATGTLIESYPCGSPRLVRYKVVRRIVGERWLNLDGSLEVETPLRGRKKLGIEFDFYGGNGPIFSQPFVNGVPHGYARQWTPDGRLIGSFRMTHGTGTDLWWHACSRSSSYYLSEVLQLRDGRRDGFEWWLRESGMPCFEMPWQANRQHGIARMWDDRGRLDDGYPEFCAKGTKVDRASYDTAARRDNSLPRLRPLDDKPQRRFPPNIARILRVTPK